jgi:hypothetical protein
MQKVLQSNPCRDVDCTAKGSFRKLRRELGAAGLIATSIALWKRIVAEQRPWSLILEDDVGFVDKQQLNLAFGDFFPRIAAQSPPALAVFLGWCHAYHGDR